MIKYCFSRENCDYYFELPEAISLSTLYEIMKDCGYTSCSVYAGESGVYRLKLVIYV